MHFEIKQTNVKSEAVPSPSEIHEATAYFAKKGFLLDKETIEFFLKLENIGLAEEVLNKVFALTRARLITKKSLIDHYKDVKTNFLLAPVEKRELINHFFDSVQALPLVIPSEIKEEKPATRFETDMKIISSEIMPDRRIEVKDFVTHFKNRYNFFKDVLKDRKELDGLVSINKIGSNRNFSIIGLVANKRVTKNKNIILEVEDTTGKINVLVSQDKDPLMKKAKEIILDDTIGIKCSGSRDFIYANDIIFPESFLLEKRKSSEEVYAIFISDIHVGSKMFLEENFLRFINWVNGDCSDEAMREKVKKIKYLFVTGDNVDGVGIYPGQESLLAIKDLRDQYKKLAEYFKMLPSHIKIIMCPGQHDSVRVPEPQPPVGEDFAKELTEMKNVFLVSNPALVEVDCLNGKKGLKVLLYHGASILRSWIDEIEELRTGQAILNPSKAIKFMLRHRHLSPTHSSNVYVPGENEDPMIIKDIPDIIATGDLHKSDVDMYNNTLIICGSCWQSMTPFEEKVGNHPDPCKVPMLNLKTREIKILDFT